MHPQNSFLTLTYSEENLPWSGSLDIKHVQDFNKRLRKVFGSNLKFFQCGEYGDKNNRPHYHAIWFNLFFNDRVKYKQNDNGDWIYTSEKLDNIWKLGKCTVGDVTFQSARYVAQYVMKKVTGDQAQHHYQRFNELTGSWVRIAPEFVTMSNGIGEKWLNAYADTDAFNKDFVTLDGKKHPVPRYYMKRLKEREKEKSLTEDQHLEGTIRRRRAAKPSRWNTTDRRLRIREEVAEAKLGLRKREL